MNKVVLLTLIGILALATGGCSFFADFADSQENLEENAAQSNPGKKDSTQAQLEATGEDFADLDLDQSETKSLPEIVGLIPATDPDARVRSSVRGRSDPFSTVPLTPRIKLKEEAKKAKATEAKRSTPIANSNNNINTTSSNNNTNIPRNPQISVDSNPTASAPPTIIEPTLAREVLISGMFEANGKTRLIVKAPEEKSSRYVDIGEYLSNGQVLVKRIERNRFSNPKVILEQSGVEVRKTIGEDSADDNKIGSLPATMPSSDNWGTAISLK